MKKARPKPTSNVQHAVHSPGHLPPPPRGLKEAGCALWSSIIAEFVVDDAGSRTVLKEICLTADLIADCRAQIAKEGLTIPTKNGSRDHPLTRTLLMSQSFMTRSLIRLGAVADAPPKNPIGRPPMGGRGVTDAYLKNISQPGKSFSRPNGDDA